MSGDGGQEEEEKVGYGRPPKAYRFPKGHSGNPDGRPKRKKDVAASPEALSNELVTAVLKEARKPVTIRENGETIRITGIQAVVARLRVDATQGNPRAQQHFLALAELAEAKQRQETADQLQSWTTHKLEYKRRSREIRDLGLDFEILPHGDDVVINGGVVTFNGPTSPAEKAWWDELDGQRQVARATLKRLAEAPGDLDGGDTQEEADALAYERIEAHWLLTYADHAAPPSNLRRGPGFDLRRWRKHTAPDVRHAFQRLCEASLLPDAPERAKSMIGNRLDSDDGLLVLKARRKTGSGAKRKGGA